MLPYIPHVALLISICYIFYKVFLEKETFFNLNRWLLVSCLIFSFYLPTIEIPADWSIWPNPDQGLATLFTTDQSADLPTSLKEENPVAIEEEEEPEALPPLAGLEEEAEEELVPITSSKEEAEAGSTPTPIWYRLNWLNIIWIVYLAGVAIFAFNLLIQLFVLIIQMFRLPSIKDGRFRIVELQKDKAPYSFLNCIFINPSKYDWDTYNQILDHEKIHIRQLHTVDMILAELLVVFQWFNPLAWYYRKAIENNLEYLTDHTMLNGGVEREPYQMNLLKVSVPHYPIGLAMNYNQSILKKRIKMMNAKKSSVRTSWKYLAIIPLLGITVICFNAIKAATQYGQDQISPEEHTSEEFEEQLAIMEEHYSQVVEAVEEKINNFEEGDMVNLSPDIDLPNISLDLGSTFGGKEPQETKGVWQAEIDGNTVCVRFDNSDFKRGSHWISTECFKKSEFSSLPTSESTFTLKRDPGTVNFKGKFEGDEGLGRYEFVPSAGFTGFLKQQGVRGEAKNTDLFHMFLANFDEAFVRNLKQKGFKLEVKGLVKLAIHGVNQEYINEMAASGYDDLSLDDLVKGRIHGVDPDYIKDLKSAGFDGLDFEDLVRFSVHGVDADIVEALADAGFDDLDADDIVRASVHGIDPDYIEELKDAGYEMDKIDDIVRFAVHGVDADLVADLKAAGFADLDADEITKAAVHGVDGDYVKEIAEIGYDIDDIDDIVSFAVHGVDAGFVKELKKAGYADLSAEDIRKAAVHGVDEDYIRDLKETGYELPDIDDVVGFMVHGVDVDFIEALADAGYKDLSPEEIKKAAVHGIDARYIKELKEMGFELEDIEDVVKFRVHGVRPSYVKAIKDLGYTDLDADDITKGATHGIKADFIEDLNDLGFKNIPWDQVINLRVHGVDARFIKRARDKGYNLETLEEYKKLKIHGFTRD